MERTQISLEPEQAERLRQLADERGVSMAHLIRDAVDRVYGAGGSDSPEVRWERARRAIGVGRSGASDVGREHDRYLEDAFSQ